MDNEYPKYLYKYRCISNLENLSEDLSIDALFKCQAIFTSRKNFNDLFDSKINIVKATPKQVKELAKRSGKKNQHIRSLVANGKFTEVGYQTIKTYEENFNKLIDSYTFFCLSKNCKSNLMWSHYADSHKGFCIEFKSEHIKAEKVSYQDEIPQVEMISLLGCNHPDNAGLGNEIWQCLRTKLKEWEYEEEYRFQMAGYKISEDEIYRIQPYESEFIESIIFGCRMPESIKEYIIKNLPYKVKFKEAVKGTSNIYIKDMMKRSR